MAYAELEDIQAKLPNVTFGDPPYDALRPTEAEVEAWLDEVSDNVIDPVIRTLVTDLPVTDSHGLAWLKQMAINWVCAEVYRALQAAPATVDAYKRDFDNAMKLMMKSPTILQKPQGGGAPTHRAAAVDEPDFRRGETQW
ncbi:MAG: hypothetical protein IT186_14060 [Acidobacteria bacterium]|nr:hypothetical protein [Acidobacteriota bacterium]